MMRQTDFAVLVLLLTCASSALMGQQYFGLGRVGYRAALPARVAPGQIISITVPDSEPRITLPVLASKVPLPTALAGFSVVLRQTAAPNLVDLPVLGVVPVAPNCPLVSGADCGAAVRVDVQIPFELVPDYSDGDVGAPVPLNEAVLVVRKRGIPFPAIPVAPRSDSIHILSTCDALTPGDNPPCRPIITHADGILVTEAAPAKAGEVLVLYAYGLGATSPALRTGVAAAAPGIHPVSTVRLFGEFGPFRNANVLEVPGQDAQEVVPAYVGLVEGFVGLYQINFRVGQPPSGTPACGVLNRPNFVLTVSGFATSDSAALCIDANPTVLQNLTKPGPSSKQ